MKLSTKLRVKVNKYLQLGRALYYSNLYTIGKGCTFQKIKFYKPLSGDMGKQSINIGNKVVIFRQTELVAYDDKPIIIGDNTFINQECLLRPNVTIGSNVAIGMRTSLISDSHEIGSSECRAGKASYLPITIGDGCWVGANCTILGGVTLGKGCVIAAGSLVNKDCEPNGLYGGVPARLIRKLH